MHITDMNSFDSEAYTRGSVDRALDSSRYFVMRVVDPTRPNAHAFIGIGFQERDEAYEFENALRTHDKYAQRQLEVEKQKAEWAAQHKDLSLKSGQTIQVNIKTDASKPAARREPRTTGGLTFNFGDPAAGQGFFAPPPSSSQPQSSPSPSLSSQPDWISSIPMAPSSQTPSQAQSQAPASSFDFFSSIPPSQPSSSQNSSFNNDWTDFSSGKDSKNSANDSWATF